MKRRKRIILAAVVVALAVVVGGSLVAIGLGGDDTAEPDGRENARQTEPLATRRPTPGPTSTPFVPPTPDIPAPMPVTPTPAGEGGRPDCPGDRNVYWDPDGHFSLCYPREWSAISSPPDANLGTAISLSAPENASMTLYWKQSSYFDSPASTDRCGAAPAWEELQEVTFTVAGRSVIACTGYETLHDPDAPPLRSTFVEIPGGAGGGYVVLFLTEAEGSAHAAEREASASVLESLRLGD